MPSAYLIMKNAAGERELALAVGSVWRIGREKEFEIRIENDSLVSRNHGLLQRLVTGEFQLVDVGSRNGSHVNGRRVVTSTPLKDGDEILIGETLLLFHQPPATSTSPGPITDTEVTGDTVVQYVCQEISVLVVDIRDFCGLSQRLEESVLAQTIGNWYRTAGALLRKYDCWSEKYIGDAVMAIWRHRPGKEEVELTAMLKVLAEFAEYTSQMHTAFSLPYQLRIGAGINTGHAMIGNAGAGAGHEYTALGDAVNAAFRFETATKTIGEDLLIGEMTHRCLERAGYSMSSFRRHIADLKGFEKPMTVYGCKFAAVGQFAAK